MYPVDRYSSAGHLCIKKIDHENKNFKFGKWFVESLTISRTDCANGLPG